MCNIAKAILVVGLAMISVTAHIMSDGEIGAGWGFLAVLVLLTGSCSD